MNDTSPGGGGTAASMTTPTLQQALWALDAKLEQIAELNNLNAWRLGLTSRNPYWSAQLVITEGKEIWDRLVPAWAEITNELIARHELPDCFSGRGEPWTFTGSGTPAGLLKHLSEEEEE